jgi:hypothetical protein
MDFLPADQQIILLLGNQFHNAADVAPLHAINPNQFWTATGSQKINLGLTVTKNMDMGWFVIIQEDDNANP